MLHFSTIQSLALVFNDSLATFKIKLSFDNFSF